MDIPAECHPKVAGVVDYWRSIHPPDGLPGRQHLDPVDIAPEVLTNVLLLDVAHDPLRFRFRLLGTSITRFAGRDNTGKWLHELYANFEARESYKGLARVVGEGVPDYRAGPPVNVDRHDWVRVERVYLPLARDARAVDMILGLTVFQDTQGRVW